MKWMRFLVYVAAVAAQSDEEEECPLVPACCEEDCCGPGTIWVAPYCILDASSPGWTGTYSVDYDTGCTARACCEEDCCSPPGTFFEITTAYCIPATLAPSYTPTGTPVPSGTHTPTIAPTQTMAPTDSACDLIVTGAQTIVNKTAPNDESANFSPAPPNWKSIPGTNTPQRRIDWLYDWEKDGDHGGLKETGGKTWEEAIIEQSCNDKMDYLTDKEKADACAKCKKEPTALKKIVCAAQALSQLLTDKDEECFHYTVALLSLLKCIGIKAEAEVYHKMYNGKEEGHAWVEVVIGGTRYMFDAANDWYVCQEK